MVTREGLGHSLGIDIDPVHIMVPSGRGQGWLQAQEVRTVTQGQHIPIWWDSRRRIEAVPVDDTSFFQTDIGFVWTARLLDEWDRSTSSQSNVEEEYQVETGTRAHDLDQDETQEDYIDECLTLTDAQEVHEVNLHTYGLFGWHLGTRSSIIQEVNGRTIREEVQRLWPEVQAHRNIIKVHALTIPQSEIHVVVEFFEGRLTRYGEMPCLRRTFNYQWERPVIAAVYQPNRGTRNDILYHAGYDDVCQPWKEHRCSVRVDNTILVADDRSQIQNGALIDIWIYDIDDDGPVSLMQRSVTITPEPEGEEQTWSTLHMPEESLPITLSIGGELTVLEKINDEWKEAGKTHGYTAMMMWGNRLKTWRQSLQEQSYWNTHLIWL